MEQATLLLMLKISKMLPMQITFCISIRALKVFLQQDSTWTYTSASVFNGNVYYHHQSGDAAIAVMFDMGSQTNISAPDENIYRNIRQRIVTGL